MRRKKKSGLTDCCIITAVDNSGRFACGVNKMSWQELALRIKAARPLQLPGWVVGIVKNIYIYFSLFTFLSDNPALTITNLYHFTPGVAYESSFYHDHDNIFCKIQ